MSAAVLESKRRGAARVLTIARERACNAISAEVTEALEREVERAASEADLRALVITGEGTRFFAAGGDIKQYRALDTREALDAAFARPRRVMDLLEALPVPVIAAVNGTALGGGAELLLATDIRLAAPHAEIGFPYVRLGLVAGWNGVERLARSCGYPATMRLLASGTPVGAEEARRIGLINEVIEGRDVVEAALEMAEGFAGHAPLAVAATKRVALAAYRDPRAEARALAERVFADLWVSEDHREAEAAFAEKRRPAFRGR